ncbi:MAG: tetraacyldisaccharide 4'-kinase [Culturomica sp.]|jgi:tetraacyldisaccharide 4'-kinase|nr:tetraacyldisaccharide 4'-kinase [Culturomica sp.]
MSVSKVLLFPFSVLYGAIVGIRNFLFDTGILASKSFEVPVFCVGNITVGGTGKTPHTEELIRRLQERFRVACLSRGYKRRTSGFILAGENATAEEIGDEPMQIKTKFPGILVAVDEKRTRGIETLLALPKPPEVIVLDDAFQHRRVKADKNIVLIDYNRPLSKDCLLPAGRLREPASALRRADYIVVTKCPDHLTPIDKRLILKKLKVKPYQHLFFTRLKYGEIKPLSSGVPVPTLNRDSALLCITGIARPEPFIRKLREYTDNMTEIRYSDHHRFGKKEVREIERIFAEIRDPDKYILTTEKDAVRLRESELPEEIKQQIFYIPVEPEFLCQGETFAQELIAYVAKNKR